MSPSFSVSACLRLFAPNCTPYHNNFYASSTTALHNSGEAVIAMPSMPITANDSPTHQVQPFLKWAGGKRWLVRDHSGFFPKQFERYIEPFVGSGAVFFHLAPSKAVLADANSELIATYAAIKKNPKKLENLLSQHQANHTPAHYYMMRQIIPANAFERAARFIYLNRTCWNGLYRVNQNGQFNVPIGTKTNVVLESDNFQNTQQRLKNAELLCSDFEPVIDDAKNGDFIFIDPPYTVAHNMNGFIKYNERLFTWKDQVRLKESVVRAIGRKVKILMLNANHESVRELYQGVGQHSVLSRTSVLASQAERRKLTEELVVCC